MKRIAICFALGFTILVIVSEFARAQNGSATPVTINFDNLPTGTNVTNQYPQVTFSANGFSTGAGGPYGNNIYTRNDYYAGGSNPNGIVSEVYPYNYPSGDVYINFPIPVNNFSFYILNAHRASYITLCYIDIFVNQSFYGTYQFYHNPYGSVFVDLRAISNITGAHIRNVYNSDAYYDYITYYDNFTFTPNLNVNITSGRVSGILNGTTQNALLGADVALSASINPSNLTGGTYSWSVTGPNQQVSATNTSSSYTTRWTETGTYQATVTYTRNGVVASSTVNVNVIVPTLDNFTAEQEPSLVSGHGPPCNSNLGLDSSGLSNSQFTLGCGDLGSPGITFSSTVHIPSGQYLSDLNQSGIKYIQRVSAFRKQLNGGVIKCRTKRSSEGDNNSGWLFDANQPTATEYDPRPIAIRRFSEGTSLTIITEDSPGEVLEGPVQGASPTPPGLNDLHQHDALKVDDYFQMYVVYFSTTSPSILRTVGKLPWNWGGEVVYDARVPTTYPFRQTAMFGGSGHKTGFASSEPITYQGRTGGNPSFVMDTCPGSPPPVPNNVDNSRFFMRQQYSDILNRVPDGAWLVWVSFITQCGFDQTCINLTRLSNVRGFYESPEFRASHSGFENPGSTQYNEQYVRELYWTLLSRPPDGAWTLWVDSINQTGDYTGLVGGFVNSPEYRNRLNSLWHP